MDRRELDQLTDEQLRREVRRKGMIVGRVLSRQQLIDLILGPTEDGAPAEEAPTVDGPRAELFATVSLARLMVGQGMRRRAEEICRDVLDREPGDERAIQVLESLGVPLTEAMFEATGVAVTQQREPGAAPQGGGRGDLGVHRMEVVLLARSPESLIVLWDGVEAIDRRAAELMGEGAIRTLRLFSTWRSSTGMECPAEDFDGLARSGDLVLIGRQPGAVHRAAVGWRGRDGAFLSLGHSTISRTPPAAPSPWRRSSWGRVAISVAPARSRYRLEGLLSRWRTELPGRSLWDGATLGSGAQGEGAPCRAGSPVAGAAMGDEVTLSSWGWFSPRDGSSSQTAR
jgi:hypothetical protein